MIDLGLGKIAFDVVSNFFVWLLDIALRSLFKFGFVAIDVVVTVITFLILRVNEIVVTGFNTVGNFFKFIWDEAVKWYTLMTGIRDSVKWFMDFCKDTYKFFEDFVNWLVGNDESGFGAWLWETLQFGLTWLGVFFKQLWVRSQNFIFENGIWLYEWVIGILDDCVGYFINLIHTIFEVTGIKVSLPSGADDAITRFVEWGMFFNEFLPITELFQLLGVFLMFLVMMSLVRFVRSFIPGFH
jgi:hypothetical protein